jgi:hypothetical protein
MFMMKALSIFLLFVAASVAAHADTDACINLYPTHVMAECTRSEYLTDARLGKVVSTMEVRSAMWAQNPKSQKKCALAPYSGVEISYQLAEANRVPHAASIPGFIGVTQNGQGDAFSSALFSGEARMVGSGSGFGTLDTNKFSGPGLYNTRLVLSKYGTTLSGSVVSTDGRHMGSLEGLSFECDIY